MDVLNFIVFAAALSLGLLQHLLDRESTTTSQAAQRWWANSIMFAAHTSAVTLFAAAITWLTRTDAAASPGLLNIGQRTVGVQSVILLLVLGFVQYWQHRIAHQWLPLWTLHRIHHTDTAMDATTGLRHHPFETMINYIPVLAVILILTPSAGGMLGYLLPTFAFAIFTHISPAWVPARLDRRLSLVIMTPRLHQLHHSTWQPETDTNYGSILVIWDKLFGTFLPAPDTLRDGFALGLDTFPAQRAQDPFLLIASPFLPDGPSSSAPTPD